uniref:BZIP transcription factor putative n=1 Tax=Albugo laibachii Nc14 TaxID=890382 RepID=F0WFT3_9STRA|nr:bZIP transcription factor putative [Albugo laibachii Nc14]|eukprot:CCA20067.1 bZIP transcription factor putative [Albugo laibachii Nc14]
MTATNLSSITPHAHYKPHSPSIKSEEISSESNHCTLNSCTLSGPSRFMSSSSSSSTILKSSELTTSTPSARKDGHTSTLYIPQPSSSCKAQRAVRRDVVNARRDKRKQSHGVVSSPSDLCEDEMIQDFDQSKTKRNKLTANETDACSLFLNDINVFDEKTEERLREMEAQMNEFDSESKEAKKKRRLIRNRMSAQLHRERKKAYVGHLEQELKAKDEKLQTLTQQLAKMAKEHQELQQRIQAFENLRSNPFQNEAHGLDSLFRDSSNWKNADEKHHSLDKKDHHLMGFDSSLLECDANAHVSNWPASSDYALPEAFSSQWEPSTSPDIMFEYNCDHEVAVAANTVASVSPKKNIAMMMAVILSVSFFGDCANFFNKLASGSKFSYIFDANSPTHFSQFNVASRILASLEKTTWKEYRDPGTWTGNADTSKNSEGMSPSLKSEVDVDQAEGNVVDTKDPVDILEEKTGNDNLITTLHDSLEDFFESTLTNTLFLDEECTKNSSPRSFTDSTDGESDEENPKKCVNPEPRASAMHLNEKIASLWSEKHQVLMTMTDRTHSMQHRSLGDFAQMVAIFGKSMRPSSVSAKMQTDEAVQLLRSGADTVTFLYPIQALMNTFGADVNEHTLPGTIDGEKALYVEVCCQLRQELG